MAHYRYILEPYNGMSTRYICPKCGNRKKTFVRYYDTQTNQHLAPNVGKCNRLINCGYHFAPKQFFQENEPIFNSFQSRIGISRPIKINYTLIPNSYFQNSLKNYFQNNFVHFLLQKFGNERTNEIINKYYVGTSKHWNGATVFWQLDRNNNVRTGKIMLYDSSTCKRVKEPITYITWVHSVLKIQDIKQCLFGEHLLSNDIITPIAIVESEKTAIIASIFLPEFIWLACGGANGLNDEKCEVLKGRKVILFPDLNCFELWSKEAKKLSKIAHFSVSDLLEKNASEEERKQGWDIADYLV